MVWSLFSRKSVQSQLTGDVALDAVYALTERGAEEISEGVLHLRPRMRALLILVDSQRTGRELLRLVNGLSHDRHSLLMLYNANLIGSAEPALASLLEREVDRAFPDGGLPRDQMLRRAVSSEEYDRFFAPGEHETPYSGPTVRYQRVDLRAYCQSLSAQKRQEKARLLEAIWAQRQRTKGTDSALSESAEALVLFLEGTVTLSSLMEKYPRILNRLADLWNAPEQLVAELDNLMLADRSDRQGFPFAIVGELAELKAFVAAAGQDDPTNQPV